MATDLDGKPLKGLGSWRWRRLFLWAVALFCMWTIAYCLVNRLESRVAETAVMMAFGTLAALAGSYVFGAVWDDRNQMQLLPGPTTAAPIADKPLK